YSRTFNQGKLSRVIAYGRHGPEHQYCFAVGVASQLKRIHRGQRRNSQPVSSLKIRRVPQWIGMSMRPNNTLASRSHRATQLAVPDPYALAQPVRRDAVADLVDKPRPNAMGHDHPRLNRPAAPRLHVRGIYAGDLQSYPNLARAWFGSGQVAHLQYIASLTVR